MLQTFSKTSKGFDLKNSLEKGFGMGYEMPLCETAEGPAPENVVRSGLCKRYFMDFRTLKNKFQHPYMYVSIHRANKGDRSPLRPTPPPFESNAALPLFLLNT